MDGLGRVLGSGDVVTPGRKVVKIVTPSKRKLEKDDEEYRLGDESTDDDDDQLMYSDGSELDDDEWEIVDGNGIRIERGAMRTKEEKEAEEKRVSNAVKGDKRFKLNQARAIYRMVNIFKRGEANATIEDQAVIDMSNTAKDHGAKKTFIECRNGEWEMMKRLGGKRSYRPIPTDELEKIHSQAIAADQDTTDGVDSDTLRTAGEKKNVKLPCDCLICAAQQKNEELIEKGALRSGYKRHLQEAGRKLGEGSAQG